MMVGPAKSLLFTAPLLIYSAAASIAAAAQPSPSSPSNSFPSSDLGGSPRNGDESSSHVSTKFGCACKHCVDGTETDAIFELDISRTDAVCGESNIRLNGHRLDLQWNGASAVGEGNVTAELADGSGSRDLSLTWQVLCISSPEDSIEDYAAEILAVTFYPAGQPGVAEMSGFAASYNAVAQPELLNLVNSPVELSDEDDSFEQWLQPPSNQAELGSEDTVMDEPSDINLEEDLEELQSLKEQAAQLQALIEEKDHKIRMHLIQDCNSVFAKLKECKCAKCFIKTSFKLVPDIFRLMKYKFGPLPSSLSGGWCRSSDRDGKPAARPRPNSEQWKVGNGPNITTDRNSTFFAPNLSISHSSAVKDVGLRYFIRNVAATIMLVSIIVILLRYCRSTITWQRRRADLAARCEQRRTLRAYRAAACRYRLRRWWGSVFSHGTQRHTTDDRTLGGSHSSSSSQTGEGSTIGAEILGLRRALEYVGGLVRNDSSSDSQLRQRPNQQPDMEELYHARVATPAPSSTAPLTTIGSPRTSSALTHDSSSISLDTVDDISSLDTGSVTLVSN